MAGGVAAGERAASATMISATGSGRRNRMGVSTQPSPPATASMIRPSELTSDDTYSAMRMIRTRPVIATVVPTTNRRVTGLGQGATVSTPRP